MPLTNITVETVKAATDAELWAWLRERLPGLRCDCREHDCDCYRYDVPDQAQLQAAMRAAGWLLSLYGGTQNYEAGWVIPGFAPPTYGRWITATHDNPTRAQMNAAALALARQEGSDGGK